ncbi:MAG TPA: carotenoid oxygenase family protein [Acidimicrobiales bacterium]|nr:carotenoid oxygenase family protein [Acidimicrobiales bacterium]
MDLPLTIDGVLPPDLQGTLLRAGPGRTGSGGALHAIELRDGSAVSYRSADSTADATVFWHAGSVLALAETGLPQQFSRHLAPEEFGDGLTMPVASHTHLAAGHRVLFGLDSGGETTQLRAGEWDASGGLVSSLAVTLERETWQHDFGVTERHLVLVESPTEHSSALVEGGAAVPYRWVPGAETWVAVVARDGDGSDVRWFRLDPCLVTHVLHAYDEGGDSGAIVLYVCCYPVPEKGQPVDLAASVLGAAGIGESLIGGGLPTLERWRISGERVERAQIDDRFMEYARTDPLTEGGAFRHGYCVELAAGVGGGGDIVVDPLGLLRIDTARDEVATWSPEPHHTASEPLFVRAADGHGDDEGWLLSVVFDATRDASDLYVLDASSFSVRSRPVAVVHLPVALPFRSHGEWVDAARYR